MDLYSRMVATLKVLLPLVALAILSTLFLLSKGATPTAEIPFADHEVTTRVQGQQVTGPVFSGITSAGDEIVVSAQSAWPGSPDSPAQAEGLRASITAKDGAVINLTSDHGSVAMREDIATFTGNVVIDTTTGYRLTTEELNASLTGVSGFTPGQVEGTSPMGELTAGNMKMSTKNPDGPIHLQFKNGVKLVYDPQKAD